jgi:hypothetical protein
MARFEEGMLVERPGAGHVTPPRNQRAPYERFALAHSTDKDPGHDADQRSADPGPSRPARRCSPDRVAPTPDHSSTVSRPKPGSRSRPRTHPPRPVDRSGGRLPRAEPAPRPGSPAPAAPAAAALAVAVPAVAPVGLLLGVPEHGGHLPSGSRRNWKRKNRLPGGRRSPRNQARLGRLTVWSLRGIRRSRRRPGRHGRAGGSGVRDRGATWFASSSPSRCSPPPCLEPSAGSLRAVG